MSAFTLRMKYDSMTGVFKCFYYKVMAAYCMNLVLFL